LWPSVKLVSALTGEKLPRLSVERTVTEKLAPAVAEAGTEVIFSLAAAAGSMVKVLEVPACLPLLVRVAVIVEEAPDWLRVIVLLLRTPAVKAALVPPPAPIVRFEVRSTVPLKPVTVLSN